MCCRVLYAVPSTRLPLRELSVHTHAFGQQIATHREFIFSMLSFSRYFMDGREENLYIFNTSTAAELTSNVIKFDKKSHPFISHMYGIEVRRRKKKYFGWT